MNVTQMSSNHEGKKEADSLTAVSSLLERLLGRLYSAVAVKRGDFALSFNAAVASHVQSAVALGCQRARGAPETPLASRSWEAERCAAGRPSRSRLRLCLQVPFICRY